MFTKNRSDILYKTILQLTNANLSTIVLDDSTNTKTKRILNEITKNGNNIYYHGRSEQKELLQKFTKLGSDLDYFIKPLGSNGWNLGYVRNYAIILTKTMGFDRVLFMDDDIIIKDVNIIKEMMKLLDSVDVVGAEISGMPDDSVVGHIMRELGIKPYEFLSGGFLTFNLDSVSEYFFNYYNEDWIWLFLHKPKVKLTKYGKVHQLSFNPFENAVERALQQEFGEILVDGVHVALNRGNFLLLVDKTFWDAILGERAVKIEWLMELCKEKKVESIAMDVCRSLLDYHLKINPDIFSNVFIDYFNNREKWLFLFDELSNEKLHGMMANFKSDRQFRRCNDAR